MSIFYKIEILGEGLFHRRRLSLLNTRDNHEVWHTHISPINIIMALVSILLLLFILVLTLVGYTPILDILPGYSADVQRSRQNIVENIMRIDSMERVIDEMMLYTENVSLIMDGKTPVVRAKSTTNTNISKDLILPNSTDSILRQQMESNGRYNLRAANAILGGTPLVAPVDGVISRRFDLSENRFGVEITTTSEQRIMATQDGVVMLLLWSPEIGHTIQLLHGNDLISIYQNIPLTTIARGDVVKAGEVIGYNGNNESINISRKINFELWQDGAPIDPERYIIFE